MKAFQELWKGDKLRFCVVLCWLMTVASSFWGSAILSVKVPAIGELFLFRLFLPITLILYGIWAVRHKQWRPGSTLETWCWILAASLILCGFISLFRAIEVGWTFRRLFNLFFDLGLFLLMLRLCRDKKIRRLTITVIGIMLTVIMLLGAVEVFCGGLVNDSYDNFKRFHFLMDVYQFPVVFSPNTNDYTSAVLFCMGLLLLEVLQPGVCIKKRLWGGLAVFGTLGYFLFAAASARLILLGFWLLWIGILLYSLLRKKRAIKLPVLLLCGVLLVQILAHYPTTVYPAYLYIQKTLGSFSGEVPSWSFPVGEGENLDEEFFEIDPVTGEKVLRDWGSAGERAHLLIHAGKCFTGSYGLGVGMGNTELLARDLQVNPAGKWSIHCFLIRLVADCGIFALIPLCAIVWLILRRLYRTVKQAFKAKDRDSLAYAALLLFVLIMFPVVSTSSSDAQDIAAMWLYLGGVVLLCDQMGETTRLEGEMDNA